MGEYRNRVCRGGGMLMEVGVTVNVNEFIYSAESRSILTALNMFNDSAC